MRDEVAGDVVLQVEGPKCLLVVCWLDDPSTGVSHECRDTAVVWPLAQRVMKLMGVFQHQRGTNCRFVVLADVLF